MLLIIVSNILVGKGWGIPVRLSYVALIACLAISFWISPDKLFFESVWLRGLVATAVLCMLVFFAGNIFIQSFSRIGFSGEAFGSNLMGALVGASYCQFRFGRA